MFTLLTEVDTNDGDMVIETYTLTDETMEELMGVVSSIPSGFWGAPRIEDHSFEKFKEWALQYMTSEEYELFEEYIPVPDHGYATLETMSFFPGEKTLLKSF